jgi:conjugative transfer pilus assembly protein TraH
VGCGGIDLFAGSFSFINEAQFVALLKNIGQNALGYFFQLALKSMAPEIAVTLEWLQDQAQKINALNVNLVSGRARNRRRHGGPIHAGGRGASA